MKESKIEMQTRKNKRPLLVKVAGNSTNRLICPDVGIGFMCKQSLFFEKVISPAKALIH